MSSRSSLVKATDAPELIAANLRSRAEHGRWSQPCTGQAEFDAWFAVLNGSTNLALLAREVQSGAIAGVFNFSQIVLGNFCSAYLGFYGIVDFARQGLMTEALRGATQYAFSVCGLHRLEANIQPDNLRSIALVKRAGFHREGFSHKYLRIDGQWRDHERWALLSEEAAG